MKNRNNIDDIRDDEIRIINPVPDRIMDYQKISPKISPKGRSSSVWYIIILLVVVVISITVVLIIGYHPNPTHNIKSEIESNVPSVIEPAENHADNSESAYTEMISENINDVPLTIYIPHNAKPRLVLGIPSFKNVSIILSAQAADVRADNGKIAGSFILNGEVLAKGSAKKGFCSIINGWLTIGVLDNTSLFEEAMDSDGYFFRQYPLVDNGVLVENKPKGKSIRKALCEKNGQVMIIFSDDAESFHDFAQALVDFGVNNAIYLVGGQSSYGFSRDKEGNIAEFSEKRESQWEYANSIVWEAIKTNESLSEPDSESDAN